MLVSGLPGNYKRPFPSISVRITSIDATAAIPHPAFLSTFLLCVYHAAMPPSLNITEFPFSLTCNICLKLYCLHLFQYFIPVILSGLILEDSRATLLITFLPPQWLSLHSGHWFIKLIQQLLIEHVLGCLPGMQERAMNIMGTSLPSQNLTVW